MTAGRPRKPAALKQLEGTARKDRTNERAPKRKLAALPPPPKDLTKSAQSAWRALAKVVNPLRVATAADVIAFRQMAIMHAMVDDALFALPILNGRRQLDYTLDTESGAVIRPRPAVATIATFQKLLGAAISKFGLTPADHERVSALNDNAVGDPLDEFAIGGGNGS